MPATNDITTGPQEPETTPAAATDDGVQNDDVRQIVTATAQSWTCPFCGVANGIPEVVVCACGAALVGDGTAGHERSSAR
jgi:hypothetical protein